MDENLQSSLERYLHEHIPVSAAMGIEVEVATFDSVRLSAPLANNINHRETAFGGSVSSLGILSAWSLIHLRMASLPDVSPRIVIQRNSMEYERAVLDRFVSETRLDDSAHWERFRKILFRKGRARLNLQSELNCLGERVGYFDGSFVVIDMNKS